MEMFWSLKISNFDIIWNLSIEIWNFRSISGKVILCYVNPLELILTLPWLNLEPSTLNPEPSNLQDIPQQTCRFASQIRQPCRPLSFFTAVAFRRVQFNLKTHFLKYPRKSLKFLQKQAVSKGRVSIFYRIHIMFAHDL